MNIKQKAPMPKRLGATVEAAIFAASGGADVAATEPAEDDLIEEIIVTANKRSQSVQDVADVLKRARGGGPRCERHQGHVRDPARDLLTCPSGRNSCNQKITIRSISEFNRQPGVGGQPRRHLPVQEFHGAPLSTGSRARRRIARTTRDVYGRNSNGGAVNFISAAAYPEAEGMLRIGYAQYDETKIKGVYSGPIGDRVAFRISADRLDRGEGWLAKLGARWERLDAGRVRQRSAQAGCRTHGDGLRGPHVRQEHD